MKSTTTIPDGLAISDGLARCLGCRAAVYQGDRYCPCCGRPVERICPACGELIRATIAFYCPCCGEALARDEG